MSEPSPLEILLGEIAEQPEVLTRLLHRAGEIDRLGAEIDRFDPAAVVLAARGSSDHAAIFARYLFEIRNRRLTSLAAPSAVTLYCSGPDLRRTLVIGVSQSGQGEDVRAFVERARAQGALTLAVTNDPSSPLARSAALSFDLGAGVERSVPATKTVTAQLLFFALLSNAMTGEARLDFSAVPETIRSLLAAPLPARVLAPGIPASRVLVLGRGFAFPVALETALKLKETSYTHAEALSAADFTHGPLALATQELTALIVDVGGRSSEPARVAQRQIEAHGGRVVLLGMTASSQSLTLPAAERSEPEAAISSVVLAQQLAVEVALARGFDPARPMGIQKITSTR